MGCYKKTGITLFDVFGSQNMCWLCKRQRFEVNIFFSELAHKGK